MRAEIKAYAIYMEKRLLRRANSVKAYYYDLKTLVDYLTQEGVYAWADVTTDMLKLYLEKLTFQGVQWNTIQHKSVCFHVFFDFLVFKKGISQNPALKLITGKQGRKTRRILPISKIRHLVQTAQTIPKTGKRDALLVELLYSDWIQLADLPQLTAVRLPQGRIVICRGTEPISKLHLRDSVSRMLSDYLGRKDDLEPQDLFTITNRQVSNVLRKVSLRAGIEPCVTPLMLKDSYAVHAQDGFESIH